MTSRKPKTFEEKINAFMKRFESSNVEIKRDFLERFSYLDADEVGTLFDLCEEIEDMAYKLACQVVRKSNMSAETQRATMQAAIEKKYPYLDEVRVYRLISRKLYWAYH
jgi:hypothetical protein